MKKSYATDLRAALHETALDLYEMKIINKMTMRNFDRSCLTELEPFEGSSIKILREREGVSQAVFAAYLNIGKNVLSDWERDVKKPSNTSLRLLHIIKKHGLNICL